MLLPLSVVRAAAQMLLNSAILDEVEDVDSHAAFREPYVVASGIVGGKIHVHESVEKTAEAILTHDESLVMFVMGTYIGAISKGWGISLGLVFYHMGILASEDEAAKVLYRLIMSCWGHGIGIDDDHSNEFDQACGILQIKRDPSPADFDQHESWTTVLVENYLKYPDTR